MTITLLLALALPAQISIKGKWYDTLRPDWRRMAGLEEGPAPGSPSLIAPEVSIPSVPQLPLVAASTKSGSPAQVSPNIPAITVPDSSWHALVPESLVVASLSVRQAEIRDLLPALSQQQGVNVVLEPDVSGKVTLNLKKVRLRDVLRLISDDQRLDYLAAGSVLRVRKRVMPASPAPPKPVCLVEVQGGLVSLDAQGATVDQVVRALGQVAGINLVVPADVSQSVRVLLRSLPPRRLVAALGEGLGLEMREQAGVYTLSRPAPLSIASGTSAPVGGLLRIWVDSDTTVSIDANQASLANAVNMFAERLGLSLVVLGSLQGQVTLRLVKSKPEQAMEFLFAGSEYTWWKRDGAWVVGPSGSPGVANSELLVLKHVKAEDALELIPQSIQKNAQLKLVKSHNGIMVLGARESIEGVRAYLKHLDYPVPQILIEALVVDIDMDKIRNMGMRAFLGKAGIGSNSRAIYPNVEQAFGSDDANAALGIAGLKDVVKLPDDFFLKINALEQEKLLQVRSRPQISTLNGSEAKLSVGQTQYFLLNSETDVGQVTGTTVQTTQRFEKIEANVTLTVTPYVSGEGEITCEIVPDFSEPEGAFDSKTPPTINHRVFKSRVRLRDGETIILGGLVKESINRVNDQVPLLGSIPILGWLFKNHNTTKSRSQLMIFVTPHIYYGEDSKVDPDEVMKSLTK